MKFLIISMLMLLLTACVTLSLGPVEKTSENIQLEDKRIESEKKSYRESALSSYILLGDDDFDKNPTVYIKDALSRKKPHSVEKINLQLSKFRIIDNFPDRMSKSTSAALSGAMTSMGYSTYYTSSIENKDSIMCVLEGVLNGRSVKSVSTVPYKISKFAGAVRSQPEFIAAVKESIEKCVESAIKQARST